MLGQPTDLAIFFADGDPLLVYSDAFVTLVTATQCHEDFPEEVGNIHGRSTAGVIQGKLVILYATASANLKPGTYVTVAGKGYQVSFLTKVDDGQITQAHLNSVASYS